MEKSLPKVIAEPSATNSSNGTQQEDKPSGTLPKIKAASTATRGKNSARSDEKGAEAGDKRNKTKKGKKGKKAPSDSPAPRQPLTDRAEKDHADNPNTEPMAEEGDQLRPDQRQAGPAGRDPHVSPMEIPIFTKEFLNHDASVEEELCRIMKFYTEGERKNAILEKQTNEMKTAMAKLEAEAKQNGANNTAMMKHLNQMRTAFIENLGSVSVPGFPALSMDNIDSFVFKINEILQDPSTPNREELTNKVRDAIERLEFCE